MLSNTVIFLNNWCDFILIRYFGSRFQSWLPLKFNNRPPRRRRAIPRRDGVTDWLSLWFFKTGIICRTSEVPLEHFSPGRFYKHQNTKQSLVCFGYMAKILGVTEWHQFGHVDVSLCKLPQISALYEWIFGKNFHQQNPLVWW